MSWIRGELLWVRRSREGTGPLFVIRRQLGIAVVRNHLKRRLRSISRSMGGYPSAVVILARDAAVSASFQDLRDEYSHLVAELGEGVQE